MFYLNSEAELESVRKKLIKNKINAEVPRNPYWAANGIMIFDPDNHKVVFALKNYNQKIKAEQYSIKSIQKLLSRLQQTLVF